MTSHHMPTLVRRYLAHRRALGFQLSSDRILLRNFAHFADRNAPGQSLSSAVAIQWAALPKNNNRGYHAKRLGAVRRFALYCSTLDPDTQIPPAKLFPTAPRLAPHIYSKAQISLMLRRARQIPCPMSLSALRPFTFETVIGLIYCTGLRPAEVFRLRLEDLDARARTLLVPATKSSPRRLLPLHQSAVRALERYRDIRLRLVPTGVHLFVGCHGKPIYQPGFAKTFRALVAGIPCNGARSRPRLQDLRHTFATRTIAKWSKKRTPLSGNLLSLSRYMGHKSFNETWWYVSPDNTALGAVAAQFHAFQKTSLPHSHSNQP